MTNDRFYTTGLIDQLAKNSMNQPHDAAAHFEGSTLSYRQLQIESSCIASELQRQGIKKGDTVGVYLPPGIDILKAIFAIFKLGAVYMPLNPDHPRQHIELILEESQPASLVTLQSITETCLPETYPRCLLDKLNYERDDYEATLEVSANDPAYLMFTSGTTGRPKGVQLSNENLAHFIGEAHRLIDVRSNDVFCNLAKFTFSISLFDLLVPLTFGAAVRFLRRETVLDFETLVNELKASTVLHAGPALLSALFRFLNETGRVHELSHMKHVSTGGDIVLPVIMDSMKRFFPAAELFVFYGCTEIACMGTFFKFADSERSQQRGEVSAFREVIDRTYVGRPFPGMKVMLIDEMDHLVASGETGEICFSGRGLALAYLNQPDLTKDRFCPFSEKKDNQQNSDPIRIYRTGDFGRYSPQGILEILGRRDFQVQLRGVRIELSAIENRIIQLGLANQCVVVKRFLKKLSESQKSSDIDFNNSSQTEILFSFLVSPKNSDERKTSNEIAQILANYLPSEMIPSAFHYIDSLPTNFNGKLDRKQLQTMEIAQTGKDESKFTPVEKAIAGVLKERLNIDSLDRHDNFFALGGHSLMAILVVAELERKHHIQITIADFFQKPSVAGIASIYEDRSKDPSSGPDAKRPGCAILKLSETSPQKKKIFLLAGANIYHRLAKELEAEWSVYGLVSDKEVFPVDVTKPLKAFSVEELAEDYYEAIVAEQNSGPYYILGHSFGGIVAYHLAKMLEERNYTVRKLVLVDALIPEWADPFRFRIMQFLRIFRSNPVDLWNLCRQKLNAPRVLARLKTKLMHSNLAESGQVDLSSITYYTGVLAEMDEARVRLKREAAVAYMKRIKPGFDEAILFLSKVRHRQNPLHSKTLTWHRYIRRLRMVWIDVGHTAMIQESNAVAKISQELREKR
ncbi:MAG: alpha/beta fold hydrolase [Oligoflexus sp.]